MGDRLKGRVAIVTGGGRGIGRGEALMLAVAHPDCQAELKDEAQRIYGWPF